MRRRCHAIQPVDGLRVGQLVAEHRRAPARPGRCRGRRTLRGLARTAASRSRSPHHHVSIDASSSVSPSRCRAASARNGCSHSRSATPLPSALATPTLPSRTDCSKPVTPPRPDGRELERIGSGVGEAAEHDVDLLETAERAQPHPPATRDQVSAAGQVIAEVRGEVRRLDEARALRIRARAGWFVARRRRLEPRPTTPCADRRTSSTARLTPR